MCVREYICTLLLFLCGLALFFFNSRQVNAYTNGMSASIVVGQTNFTSGTVNQGSAIGANTLSSPSAVFVYNNQLFISDNVNQRILIYNSIPTSNNASANVVIGQTAMNTANTGCTAAKVNLGDGGGILAVNGKFILADTNNNRVLIFNSIPTANGASADIVIGQPNTSTCTTNTGGVNAKSLSSPDSVSSDGTKLVISDKGNNRVLIFNTIPTSNNAAADVVLGQPGFSQTTANNGGIAANTLSSPRGVAIYNNNLIVADEGNARLLVFNSIPGTNNYPADTVIGQPDFVSSRPLQGGKTPTAQTVQPFHITIDAAGRILATERTYNRVVQYSMMPTAFSAFPVAADAVIGQGSFTTSNANTSATGLFGPKGVYSTGTQLFIADSVNNRVVIYTNNIQQPGITIDNGAQGQPDGTVKISGTATVNQAYTIKDVQYEVNGGAWTDANPTDGDFNTGTEQFSIDFDPTSNNNMASGYTAKLQVISSNGDVSGNAFYFVPFLLNKPDTGDYLNTSFPTFDFSVNTELSEMSNGLTKYQIWISRTDTTNWQLYIDNIPVDFTKARNDPNNTFSSRYGPQSIAGVYDNQYFNATYDENSSHILVHAKNPTNKSFEQGGTALSGGYKWKAVAVDNTGHTQESETRFIRVNTTQLIDQFHFFPLTISYISGLGNVDISTIHTHDIQPTYTVSSLTPTISGIATANSNVYLTVTDTSCVTNQQNNCSSTFSAVTGPNSHYGINIPDGTLQDGKNYQILLSTSLNNDYIELPKLSFSISQNTNTIGEIQAMKVSSQHTHPVYVDSIFSS